MKKNVLCGLLSSFLLIIMLFSLGCSGNSSSTVSGTASEGAIIANGKVLLKDANGKVTSEVTTDANGLYKVSVDGLTPPFIIKVTSASGKEFYSFSETTGVANVNPMTTAIVSLAANTINPSILFNSYTPENAVAIKATIKTQTDLLNNKLLDLYSGVGLANPDFFKGEIKQGTGLDALFDTIKIDVKTSGIDISNAVAGTLPFLQVSFDNIKFGVIPDIKDKSLLPTKLNIAVKDDNSNTPNSSSAGQLNFTNTPAGFLSSFAPLSNRLFIEPIGPFGNLSFANNDILVFVPLAKFSGATTHAVTGFQVESVAKAKVPGQTYESPQYEWFSTSCKAGEACTTAFPGVTIDLVAKKVTVTNITLDNISQVNPTAGKLTVNGSLTW